MDNLAYPLWSLAIGGLIWVAQILWELVRSQVKWEREREEALAHFFVDILTIKKNLECIFSDNRRCDLLNVMQQRDFRPYIAAYEEDTKSKYIASYLASLSPQESVMIHMFLMHHGLFCEYYNKLGSDDFMQLSTARKVDVTKELYKMADRVLIVCDQLIPTLKSKRHRLYQVEKSHACISIAMDALEKASARQKTPPAA